MIFIRIKGNCLGQKASEKWEKVYRTYANEVIEIATKIAFNLLKTIEKILRSLAS